MKAFHAYDVRGIYNVDFDKTDAYKIGFFLPKLLNTNKILVGRDARTSSPEIHEYLCKGINDSGADVYDVGLSTTPMIYFLTANQGFDASVMITASHNAKEYNGLKISRAHAMPVGYDTGLGILEKMINTQVIIPANKRGVIHEFDMKSDYIAFLKSFIKTSFYDLKLSVDCSNGMAGLLIKDVIGQDFSYIFDELDGNFPNHEANPLDQKNLVDIKSAVIENKSDLGVIFDRDADRVMFIDEIGNFISPVLIIGLLGHFFIKETTNETVVIQDIRTSKAVGEYLKKLGNVKVETWKVGRAFAAPKLKEIDGLFGGELAGHYYFKDFNYSDSGILALIFVLQVVSSFKKQGVNVSEIISRIKSYSNSGEINFKISRKSEAMEHVKEYFENTDIVEKTMNFDGYRLEFKDWWFNIRPSNTEPYLRLIVEAKHDSILKEKIEIIKNIIKRYN